MIVFLQVLEILKYFSKLIFPCQLEEKRKLEKEKQKEKLQADKAEKEALKKIPPGEMFKRLMSDKYSRFDEKVIFYFLFLFLNNNNNHLGLT